MFHWKIQISDGSENIAKGAHLNPNTPGELLNHKGGKSFTFIIIIKYDTASIS